MRGCRLYLFTVEPEVRATIVDDMGKVLNVPYYMALHRFYKMAYDINAETEGTAAMIPLSFSPRDNAPYLGLSVADFEKYTDFSDEQLRQHRWAEQQLQAIDDAPIRYCVQGCLRPCYYVNRDRQGRAPTPRIEQLYLRFDDRNEVVLVSRKPATPGSEGKLDHQGNFVVTDAVYEKRRDSLIALCKWEAKQEFLRKADLPVLAAGDRPVTREAQECLDHVILPDQLCGTARNVIDLTDQQLDGFECVRRRRTSNHRGSQTDGSNSSHSNSPRRRPQTDGSSNPLPAPRACTPLAMPPLVYRRRRNGKPIGH